MVLSVEVLRTAARADRGRLPACRVVLSHQWRNWYELCQEGAFTGFY